MLPDAASGPLAPEPPCAGLCWPLQGPAERTNGEGLGCLMYDSCGRQIADRRAPPPPSPKKKEPVSNESSEPWAP